MRRITELKQELPYNYNIQMIFDDCADPEDMELLEEYYYSEGAYVFLNGECHIFAKALHDKYGYKICKFLNNAHFFCVCQKEDKLYYIDVRGIITDDALFLNNLTPGLDIKDIVDADKEDIDKNECMSSRYQFAEAIINDKPDIYCVRGIK